VLAGFEHQDGWGGADRGLVGGVLFGTGLLVAHAIAGTHAKVSLGGFPPLLIVIDGIFGMFLGALGGRLARGMRERQALPAKRRELRPTVRSLVVGWQTTCAPAMLPARANGLDCFFGVTGPERENILQGPSEQCPGGQTEERRSSQRAGASPSPSGRPRAERPFWREDLAPTRNLTWGAACANWRPRCCHIWAVGRDVLLPADLVSARAGAGDSHRRVPGRTFILFHDCSHGSLLPSKRANAWLGMVLGLFVYSPFLRWRTTMRSITPRPVTSIGAVAETYAR